ncbi:MAG: hypothetical protein ACHREM_09445 [Polyangiales bacterium]
MYVIDKLTGGAIELIARFDLVDGRVAFDDMVGDPIFVQVLKAKGISVRGDGGVVLQVMPDGDGATFLHACLTLFDGVYLACNDEEELADARQRFEPFRPATRNANSPESDDR